MNTLHFLQPGWPAPAHIKAYTTFRSGWTSRQQGPALDTIIHVPEDPIWLNQTHSNIVLPATPENRDQIGDASFTSTPRRVCVALTADCLPVLITNKQGTKVAAIHAGWRGLAAGIVEETIKAMNLPAEDLLVWLGPAIGPKKFEVGKDVYDAFTTQHVESMAAFVPYTEGKWLANIYELARIRLMLIGVTEVYGGDFCTYTREDLFFSFRRDKSKKGNMANLIWIEK
jgi:YfiH family protein